MRQILIKIAEKWFYHYAPIQQIATGIINADLPIVVQFTINSEGKIKNFTILHKGRNKIENEAVVLTFKAQNLPKPPEHILYKELKINFTLSKPERQSPYKVFIHASVSIEGKYKRTS